MQKRPGLEPVQPIAGSRTRSPVAVDTKATYPNLSLCSQQCVNGKVVAHSRTYSAGLGANLTTHLLMLVQVRGGFGNRTSIDNGHGMQLSIDPDQTGSSFDSTSLQKPQQHNPNGRIPYCAVLYCTDMHNFSGGGQDGEIGDWQPCPACLPGLWNPMDLYLTE